MRKSIAIEAARIITEERISDFYKAKHKAATRLGAANTRNLPRNEEIEEALVEYQRLFRRDTQPAQLLKLRHAALEAMEYFHHFSPRLTGAVLRGTADEYSGIELHLFAGTPEEVGMFLMEQHLPYEQGEQSVTLADGSRANFPVYRLLAGDSTIRLTVFPLLGLREPPRGELDGRPAPRANIAELRALLQNTRTDTSNEVK